MKVLFKPMIFLLSLLVLLGWGCKDDDQEQVQVDPEPAQLVVDSFQSLALAGNLMQDPVTRRLSIYLPEGYNLGEKFPVVYLLHGLPTGEDGYSNPDAWSDWSFAFAEPPDFPAEGYLGWINGLIESGKMEKMIIVTPDATTGYALSMYANSSLYGNYEKFIVEEVVNYIDQNYHTINKADSRAIMGYSQGGHGAFKLGMKYPDIFGVIVGHSPFVYVDFISGFIPLILAENPEGMNGPDPTKFLTSSVYAFAGAWSPNPGNPPFFVDLPFVYPSGELIPGVLQQWQENDPYHMLADYVEGMRNMEGIFLDAGDQDELQMNVMAEMMHQALDQEGIDHFYEVHGGTHNSQLYARMEKAFSYISSHVEKQ